MAGQPVTLEPLDANLELDFSEDRCSCQRMPGPPAVGYLFSGARANTGLASGKCYFSVKLGQPMPVNVPSTPPGEPGLRTGFQARVGISRGDTPVNLLGECQNSWAFSSSGRRLSSDGPAAYAAEGFGPGDCITVFVDLSQEPGIISFARNGYLLGLAFSVPYPQTKHEAYYPHILVKNISIECDFQGILPSNRPLSLSEDFNGYEPWMRANRAPNKAMVPVRAVKPGKSPWLLMMVGLPGSGKTTKAREVAIKKADRRYIMLGIAPLLEQMRLVVSSGRNPLYMDTDQKLMDAWNELLEALINRAVTLPRNYILDQSNVMSGPRWNKLSAFRAAGFHTEAMVLVVPDHVLYERQHLQFQAENKVVPDEAMASLKAYFQLPEEGPGKEADRVLFVEQSREEARRTVDLQRQLGNAWLYWHANHLATKATPRPNHAAALADAEGAGDSPGRIAFVPPPPPPLPDDPTPPPPDGVASVARPCSPYDPMDVDVDKKDAREAADEPQGSVDSEGIPANWYWGEEESVFMYWNGKKYTGEQMTAEELYADDVLTAQVVSANLPPQEEQKQEQEKGQEQEEEQEQAQEQEQKQESMADDDSEGIPANWYWLEDKAVFKYWDGKEYTGESMTSEQLYADPVLSKQVLAYGSMLDDTEEEQPVASQANQQIDLQQQPQQEQQPQQQPQPQLQPEQQKKARQKKDHKKKDHKKRDHKKKHHQPHQEELRRESSLPPHLLSTTPSPVPGSIRVPDPPLPPRRSILLAEERPVSNSGRQGQPPPSADDEYEHRLKIIKQKLDRGHSQH